MYKYSPIRLLNLARQRKWECLTSLGFEDFFFRLNVSLLVTSYPQTLAGWHSSTMSTSTTRRSMCRSRRSFLRERATDTSSSSSRSSTPSSMWVFSHILFPNAWLTFMLWTLVESLPLCPFCPQLSFVFAEFPMVFVLNPYLNNNEHILQSVKTCGKDTYHFTSVDSNIGKKGKTETTWMSVWWI